jgi:hypothetical protein
VNVGKTKLAVLFTMNDSTFGMLQKIFQTVSFFILNTLTWSQLIPMILQMASQQLKKGLVIPIIDLDFLILAFISASSFSSGVMMDPRYLKEFVKFMWTFLGKIKFSGSRF